MLFYLHIVCHALFTAIPSLLLLLCCAPPAIFYFSLNLLGKKWQVPGYRLVVLCSHAHGIGRHSMAPLSPSSATCHGMPAQQLSALSLVDLRIMQNAKNTHCTNFFLQFKLYQNKICVTSHFLRVNFTVRYRVSNLAPNSAPANTSFTGINRFASTTSFVTLSNWA